MLSFTATLARCGSYFDVRRVPTAPQPRRQALLLPRGCERVGERRSRSCPPRACRGQQPPLTSHFFSHAVRAPAASHVARTPSPAALRATASAERGNTFEVERPSGPVVEGREVVLPTARRNVRYGHLGLGHVPDCRLTKTVCASHADPRCRSLRRARAFTAEHRLCRARAGHQLPHEWPRGKSRRRPSWRGNPL